MGRKKFTKDNSQKFHLLHRSATDRAHASEENPSPLVLFPAETNLNDRKRALMRGDGDSISMYSDRMGSVASARSRRHKDHINELGFVNDGYDYSKHFGDADGGVIYGANGLSETLLRAKHMELPEEVFAQGDLDPQMLQHAITISEECMDEDLRNALFEDADEDGAFEELDDNFISQVMEEPTVTDFDFEAHMAKLLNKSAETLGLDGNKTKAGKYRGKLGALAEEDEDGEYFDEDDMSWPSDEEDEDYEEDDHRHQRGRQSHHISEDQFDQILQEYEDDDDYDDEDGDDNDDQDDDDEGEIDITADHDVAQGRRGQFEAALDEFIQEKKAGEMMAPLPKIIRSFDRYAAESEALGPVDLHASALEQARLQEEWAEEVQELDRMAEESAKVIPICQEYLREEKVREAWDCESILSTYSTTDNLPTVLSNKRYAPKRQQNSSSSSSNSVSNRSTYSHSSQRRHARSQHPPAVSVAALLANRPAPLTGKIVLSGRLNLPAGFTPKDARLKEQQDTVQKLHHILGESSSSSSPSSSSSAVERTAESKQRKKQSKSTVLQKVDEEEEEEQEGEGEEEGNAVDSDENDDEEEEGSDDEEIASNVRRRGRETAEERKLRKQEVKNARRHKRAAKKQMKESFAVEQVKIVKALGRETAATEHVSVFRYTA